MNKADSYALYVEEHQACSMFWLFGEDTFPEMQMAIRKAKQSLLSSVNDSFFLDCSSFWPWECTEGSVAELVFHNLALQKENQV